MRRTATFHATDPERDEVMLEFPTRGIALRHWIEYSFMSHFLTAANPFSFTTTKPDDREVMKALDPGELVRLKVNDHVVSTGFIDRIEHTTSRDGGHEIRISGRDRLAQVVDSSMDPTVKIKPGDTIANVLKRVFAPYGWANDEDFALSEEAAEEEALSTEITGVKRSRKKGTPLKSFQLQQHQPTDGEGAWQFATRIASRQGLHIWLSSDGETIIVGKPSFDLGTVCMLQVGGAGANVVSSTVTRDLSGQPSVVVVDGFAGGGALLAHERKVVYAPNPGVRVRNGFVDKFAGAKKVDLFPQPTAMLAPYDRPLHLHDKDAQTELQLRCFLKRELSLRLRNAFVVRCTLGGHGFDAGSAAHFVPWTVNTMVDYFDENADVDEPLWILSRTFKRSRSGGTTTDLELIRPNTLDF
ncbi:MAG: hypothetical protein U0270_07640 [Labilithrix sp.]